jgi:hypothetical protein
VPYCSIACCVVAPAVRPVAPGEGAHERQEALDELLARIGFPGLRTRDDRREVGRGVV